MSQHSDGYLLSIAETIGSSMTCDRARIGAIIVGNDGLIRSSGYGSAPPGWPTCDQIGHELVSFGNGRQSCFRTVHAEAAAIAAAARRGIAVEGCTMYVNVTPCYDCAKMIAQVGISRVVYGGEYSSARSGGIDTVALMRKYGIQVDLEKPNAKAT